MLTIKPLCIIFSGYTLPFKGLRLMRSLICSTRLHLLDQN